MAFARAGKALVFASDASNLSRGDHNGTTDVYERGFIRHYVHIKRQGEQVLKFETEPRVGQRRRQGGQRGLRPTRP